MAAGRSEIRFPIFTNNRTRLTRKPRANECLSHCRARRGRIDPRRNSLCCTLNATEANEIQNGPVIVLKNRIQPPIFQFATSLATLATCVFLRENNTADARFYLSSDKLHRRKPTKPIVVVFHAVVSSSNICQRVGKYGERKVMKARVGAII